MQSTQNSSPILFADSGVQILCFPLPADVNLPGDQVGSGWQHCQCEVKDEVVEYGYLQWQLLRNRFYLAVDTTIGPDDAEVGYFAKRSSLGEDFVQTLTNVLGTKGKPLAGIPLVEFIIRPAIAGGGEPKDVHMVVDFGNSRTGALLVEFRDVTDQDPIMTPLQMINRYSLDAWDDSGQFAPDMATWWFSSKSHWCTPPYLAPSRLEKIKYVERQVKRAFTTRTEMVPVSVFEISRTFEDFSMVRMGREADELAGIMRTEGEVRTGVSSPKRYLWARDASWLEGAYWHMADPFDRYDPEHHATTLKGPLLEFIPEDDSLDEPERKSEPVVERPRHAPRTMMIGALYEMLCQAYTYTNSLGYRHVTGDSGRIRLLRTLTLTFPSGMIAAERQQLKKQAHKALRIFMQTLGRNQPVEPELKLTVDEASAVHLTYIWSEVKKLGGKTSLWFSVMGHDVDPGSESEATPDPAPRKRVASGTTRSGRSRNRRAVDQEASSGAEMRIACIDIGGGTSDLMIAKYLCKTGLGGDLIRGETLHRDGITLAGDHLVKRLLETTIVPLFADVVGLEPNDAQILFGKEVPAAHAFRAQRVHWMNRLFVPCALAYLEAAVNESEEPISHTDPDIVGAEVVQSLQETINRLWGPGTYNVKQDLSLYFDLNKFEDLVDEVFSDLLLDFCESIVEHEADIVLLAGLPTKLLQIRKLVETYLPLPDSRIISMYGRYAGTWYPYQDPDSFNPGVIADPKSTVVVGAATEFSARHGMLPRFGFEMSDEAARKSYYWGVMTESRIDNDRVIFEAQPEGEGAKSVQRKDLFVTAQNLIIGRKRRSRENAQASPVYWIKVLRGTNLGEIKVQLTLERHLGADGREELSAESADGTVDGQPAVLNRNVFFEWRTLADERYYLDTGGLDRLEIG
jgi:hypothetical protein